jgi:hypothetical protein
MEKIDTEALVNDLRRTAQLLREVHGLDTVEIYVTLTNADDQCGIFRGGVGNSLLRKSAIKEMQIWDEVERIDDNDDCEPLKPY